MSLHGATKVTETRGELMSIFFGRELAPILRAPNGEPLPITAGQIRRLFQYPAFHFPPMST